MQPCTLPSSCLCLPGRRRSCLPTRLLSISASMPLPCDTACALLHSTIRRTSSPASLLSGAPDSAVTGGVACDRYLGSWEASCKLPLHETTMPERGQHGGAAAGIQAGRRTPTSGHTGGRDRKYVWATLGRGSWWQAGQQHLAQQHGQAMCARRALTARLMPAILPACPPCAACAHHTRLTSGRQALQARWQEPWHGCGDRKTS